MKKYRIVLLALLALPALMGTAYADVIAGPAVAVFYAVRLLPWVLVGAVVVITVFLLRKFWKKK